MEKNGRVVEILERDGQRFARILIGPNTVVDVPAAELSLGDSVAVDSVPSSDYESSAEPEPPPRPAWRDYSHVLRMTLVFAIAIGGFIAWRAWMVPPDFGVYGHYRAGALVDVAARPVVYAGQLECVTCHDAVQEERKKSLHARISCETCHAPSACRAIPRGLACLPRSRRSTSRSTRMQVPAPSVTRLTRASCSRRGSPCSRIAAPLSLKPAAG